jgi:Ca2+:H+ antiporter
VLRFWPILVPPGSAALLAAALLFPVGALLQTACVLALVASVIASVHHAEVIAHRVGEPFGTLVLALAVTAIELALIISLMLAGGESNRTLARDTIYASIMIICNGVMGVCMLLGALRHREQSFRIEGAGPAYGGLVALSTLVLVMPGYTLTTPGPVYSTLQLEFVAVASLVLWGAFVFFQTVRHRDFFLPPVDRSNEETHAPPPSVAKAWGSLALLIVALVAVVGLAKALSPSIEKLVAAAGAPRAVVGIAIAMIVLLPETWAAIRAALANRFQSSINLALGSALACIGLTVPAVVLATLLIGEPLVLGVGPKETVLMMLTFISGSIALGTGRTNMMQGVVLLVIFAAFLFLAWVP